MKPFFKFPRRCRFESCWLLLMGLCCFFVATSSPAVAIFLTLGLVATTGALGMWQEQRWGYWIGLFVFGMAAFGRLFRLFTDFRWSSLLMGIAFTMFAKECWNAIREIDDPDYGGEFPFGAETGDDEDEDEDEDSSMVSLVLLQREPKYLEDKILEKIVGSAWGGDYSSDEDDPTGDGFVAGESPLFIIKSSFGMYLVHNQDTPYWDDKEEVAVSFDELRLRKSIEDHTAWVSVDYIGHGDEDEVSENYARISKLILDLADEHTLALLSPAAMRINVWSDEMIERLNDANELEELFQFDHAPVIAIKDDDPAMAEAVRTAKSRWPEFVEAYKAKRDDQDKFVVKVKLTVGDSTEFIWLDVIGLEPNYIHGTLGNDPVDLGDLKYGSQVEVPLEDLNDWCFFDKNGDPVGLFSVAVIEEAQTRT